MSDWESSELVTVVSASFSTALRKTVQKGGMDALEGVFKELLKKLSVPEHIVEDAAFHVFFRALLPLAAHAIIMSSEDKIDARYGEGTAEEYAKIAEEVLETVIQEFGVNIVDALKEYVSVFLGNGVAEKFMELGEKWPMSLEEPASNLTDLHVPQKVAVPVVRG